MGRQIEDEYGPGYSRRSDAETEAICNFLRESPLFADFNEIPDTREHGLAPERFEKDNTYLSVS